MCLTGGVCVLNQVKHVVLEMTYHWIGPEDAFNVWTLEFLMENLGEHFLSIKNCTWLGLFLRLKTSVQQHHSHHRLQKIARVPRIQRKAIPRPAATKAANHSTQKNETTTHICRRMEEYWIQEIRISRHGLAYNTY